MRSDSEYTSRRYRREFNRKAKQTHIPQLSETMKAIREVREVAVFPMGVPPFQVEGYNGDVA